MMIVTFNSSEDATTKLDYYNNLAFPNGNPSHFTLTLVYKHTTENVWWFIASDCIEDGGLGRDEITADIDTQDTFEVEGYQDLIDLGYLADS